MTCVDDVLKLGLHLVALDPLGHKIDRHPIRGHLGHAHELAVDAVLKGCPLDEVRLACYVI